MMRILHLRASPFLGGPERQILGYASFDFGPHCQQIVGSFIGDGEGEEFLRVAKERGIPVAEFPVGNRAALQELKHYLRDKKISLLCTHGFKADVLGVMAAKSAGIPSAAFMRGFTAQDPKVSAYEAIDRIAIRFADAVVGLSQGQVDRLGTSKNKRHLVTNAISIKSIDRQGARQDILRRFSLPLNARIIVAAGRLSPEKGHRFLIEAMQQATLSDSVFLIIFGEGPEKPSLITSVQKKRIIFAGHVPDFAALLPGADLLVNPSLKEEMPNVVLEAMASRVPVIATAVGGVPEIAGDPPVLGLVPSGDVAALGHRIRSFIDGPESAGLSDAAFSRVHEHYSPERQKQQLATLYRNLLGPSFEAQS